MLDIIIINHNSGGFLSTCLTSVSTYNGHLPGQTITVYDNGSRDDSISRARLKFPDVRFIDNKTNYGFARAANEVIKNTANDFILLLNPDVVIFPRTINSMLDFMKIHERCAILGAEILNPTGFRQPTCRRFPNYYNVLFGRRSLFRRLFPNNRFSRKYLYLDLTDERPHKVDFVEGSVMMIRRRALEDVGLFDDRYFLYLEDADLCYRMRRSQWETWWLPRSYAIHYRGETFRQDNVHPAMHHSRGFYIFFNKHYRPSKGVRIILELLLSMRLAYVIATESIKKLLHDIRFSPLR